MHPELFELKALVAGRLDALRRREIDDHLGGCAECSRHYVAMMLGSASPKTAEAEAREAAAPTRAGAQMTFAGVASGPPLSTAYGIDAPLAPADPRPPARAIPKPAAARATDLAPPSQGRTQMPVSASLVDAITRLRAESDAQARAAFVDVEPPHAPATAVPAPPAPAPAAEASAAPVLRAPARWSDAPVVEDAPPARSTAAINKVLPLGPRAADPASAVSAAAPTAPVEASLPPLPAFSFAEYDDFDVPAATVQVAPVQAAPAQAAPAQAAPAQAPVAVVPVAHQPVVPQPVAHQPVVPQPVARQLVPAAPVSVQSVAAPVAAAIAAPISVVPAVAVAPTAAAPAAARPELVVTFSSTPTRRSPLRTTGIKTTASFVPSLGGHDVTASVVPFAAGMPFATSVPLDEYHVPPTQPLSGMPPARLAMVLGSVALVFVTGMSGYRYFKSSVSTAAAAAAAAATKQVQAAAQAKAQATPGAPAAAAPAPAPVQTRIVYVREPAPPEPRSKARADTQSAPAAPLAVILPDVNLSPTSSADNAVLSATQRGATSELTRSARATSSRTVSRP